ncbi:MAG: acyltransferase [Desulfobacteraceae bacterium]|jgi:maltose O-acetyltransferase|nr:MAG: acyltransferase [Desulfobacteraceae bacterium]
MSQHPRFLDMAKRLFWDLIDRNERKYYAYWVISQIPCLFGNMLRGKYLSKRFKSCGKNLRVFAGARFRSMENLVVGDEVEIGYDNFIQALGGVTLGDNVMLAPGVKIWSVNHNYKDKNTLVYEQGQTKAQVIIGNDVFIASNAFISPGVTLPDGVVVSAGALVGVKNYPPYAIIAGNPARVVGYRRETKRDEQLDDEPTKCEIKTSNDLINNG